MSQFFITRPVFAWVIAIFIAFAGVFAIPQLPVARFPDIAPPSVSIFASYSGADAKTVSDSVIRPIEKEHLTRSATALRRIFLRRTPISGLEQVTCCRCLGASAFKNHGQ